MTEIEYESDFSASETVYTHFRSINNSDQVELSAAADDHSSELEESNKHVQLKSCALKFCEVFLLFVLITIVWLALSIPSIFFLISKIEGQNDSNATNTSVLANCTPVEYAGSRCFDYLKSYQSCLPRFGGELVYISDTAKKEETVDGIFFVTENFPRLVSPECKLALEPLACLYYLPLCDKTTNKAVLPTKQQCLNLMNKVCSNEWEMAKNRGFANYLPECDALPEEEPAPTTNCSKHEVPTSIAPPTVSCSPGFSYHKNRSQCRPSCGSWSPYSEVELRVSQVVVIGAGIVAIVSGVIVLVLACIRCKKVFSYPSIFVVYQTIPTILLGSLVIIAYVDNRKLFCRFAYVPESLNNPTFFCTLTGVCLYYITMQLILLWLFHVISIFWGVYWPIQASMAQISPKKIIPHIIAVGVALFVPAIPVCLIYFLGGGFTITRFPPILCAAKSLNLNYYTFLLPISIIVACGLTFLVLIFWKLLKKRILHRIHQTRIDTHWCAHARVLTVLSYFVVFGIIVLSTFTVSAINLGIFYENIRNYFACEARGPNITMCMDEREAVVRLVNPIITIVGLVIIGFFPAVNLVYVFHTKELKNNCMCCGVTREVEYTYQANRPYSVYQNSGNGTTSSNRGVRLDTHGLL